MNFMWNPIFMSRPEGLHLQLLMPLPLHPKKLSVLQQTWGNLETSDTMLNKYRRHLPSIHFPDYSQRTEKKFSSVLLWKEVAESLCLRVSDSNSFGRFLLHIPTISYQGDISRGESDYTLSASPKTTNPKLTYTWLAHKLPQYQSEAFVHYHPHPQAEHCSSSPHLPLTFIFIWISSDSDTWERPWRILLWAPHTALLEAQVPGRV